MILLVNQLVKIHNLFHEFFTCKKSTYESIFLALKSALPKSNIQILQKKVKNNSTTTNHKEQLEKLQKNCQLSVKKAWYVNSR